MKKILALLLTLLLAFSFAACDASLDTSSDSSGDSSTKSNEPVVVFDSENIKISYTGIVADYGVGEGLGFSVENSRSESIIVNMVDASYNDTMSAVIQPQVPLNVIIAGKKAEQPFVFSNKKFNGGKVQFKFRVLDENYKELFTTDFLEITL